MSLQLIQILPLSGMLKKTKREKMVDKGMLDRAVTTNGTKGNSKLGRHPEIDDHRILSIAEVLVKSEMIEETMKDQIIEMVAIDTNKT